jgi:hypothetical protein
MFGQMTESALRWLPDGDPAIRWQAMRDLTVAVQREQRRVAAEGWGARLLRLQDSDGRWAAGVDTPKWTSTTYPLLLLRACGG